MVLLTEIPSSSSSTSYTYHYDVFLSFRGLDTRLGFTNYLYEALVDANLTTFLDDEEIATGDQLKPELENAIKSSRASILVLSKNYASSTWCLDELVLILEQKRKFNHIVIPIFYHVEPTHVRKQQSSFGDAMAKHKERMEAETNADQRSRWAQKIESWKRALIEVADLKGKDAKGRKEAELIEEVVTEFHSRLGVPLSNTVPHLIGMDYSTEFISTWLTDGSCRTADILTVVGMSGIGKTSLAKYVFQLHSRKFHKSSFIEGINARCNERFNGLLKVQKQLHEDISKTNSFQVNDVSVYTSKIENALARKKVFIVLDDIDSLDQLDSLLGTKGLHPGSKIIITTKDSSLTERCALVKSQVDPNHIDVLLKGLRKNASLELLCIHAFKNKKPKEGYKEVSETLVRYCDGHPLALKFLGKSLHKQDVAYWEDCIKGLKNEPHSCIKKALEMSIDSLPSKNDKDLFKYIACFFVGIDRDVAEIILNACDMNTRYGITNLIDRCLLSIGWWNELRMHQLVQGMGRDLVRQESPDRPWERSLLWCHLESYEVLKHKKGTGNILGLALDMRMLEKEQLSGSPQPKTDAFSKMDNLKFLQLKNVKINGSYKHISKKLRWLCINNFHFKSIPSELPMENLVVLDLSHSNIESFDMSYNRSQQFVSRLKGWIGSSSKDKRLLGSLKILDLSYCEQLHSVSGFFELPALEKLIISNCTSLIHVSKSIEHCVELVFIDLSNCKKLKKLPRTIGKLKNLKILLSNGCDLLIFPPELRDTDSLQRLEADNLAINSQTSSPASSKVIPIGMRSLMSYLPTSLLHLSLTNNNLSNESFPMDFSSLSVLKKLYLDGNPIVSMPSCVSSLPRLELLSMDECMMLKTIAHPPPTLRSLSLVSFSWGFKYVNNVSQILLNPKMSILEIHMDRQLLANSSFEIEGMVKIQPMADVEDKVLSSLSWTYLGSIQNQKLKTSHILSESAECHVQMYYEFGIFSTFYWGKEIPNWISHRSKGSSISFTVPSSPKKLRGLNICCVLRFQVLNEKFSMPLTIISNTTKNLTWIYNHYIFYVDVAEECLIFLSHWMFGKNEMEDGDQLTITIGKANLDSNCMEATECGISIVYEADGKIEEEDVLGYYKSWNHIIGRDLSAFQLTTGAYILHNLRFQVPFSVAKIPKYLSVVALGAQYKEWRIRFRAFSQQKSDELGGAPSILISP